MKKIVLFITVLAGLNLCSGCQDYLDVIPDNLATMDHVFNSKANAEMFLYTCYSYIPSYTTTGSCVAFLGGDEFWVIPKGTGVVESRIGGMNCWNIGRGEQNSNNPYMNYWDGGNGGKGLWQAIRDCNIFLEGIHRPKDLESYDREQWVAEVTFLKAYYHFYLFQLYGPIPIVDKNIPVNASPEEIRVYREPVDKVVDYIVSLLDSAALHLELKVVSEASDLGRITKPIALALKAKVLAFAASPLMNGNPDYARIVDNRGIHLFPEKEDTEKWARAAKAAKEAIDCAHLAGHRIYRYTEFRPSISAVTRTKLSIREAVCEKWNDEIIWGSTEGTSNLQFTSQPKVGPNNNPWQVRSLLAPTLKIAEQFYSSNGVPITEDRDWQEKSNDYNNRYGIRTADSTSRYDIEEGQETAILHFNREPRFYANIGFDRGTWYSRDNKDDLRQAFHLHSRKSEYSGFKISEDYSITGYHAQKICSYRNTVNVSSQVMHDYSFPIIRLADIYLLYAEALNESQAAPTEAVYEYIDSVRSRAGLKGVKASWQAHSMYPDKPGQKAGMREIIQQERTIELALEGERFWDLRRWKRAMKECNETIRGWSIREEKAEAYYQPKNVYSRIPFTTKNYLWPISIGSIQKNPNLVQNFGW